MLTHTEIALRMLSDKKKKEDDAAELIRLRADAALVEWYFGQETFRVSTTSFGSLGLVNVEDDEVISRNDGSFWPTYLAAIRKAKEMRDGRTG